MQQDQKSLSPKLIELLERKETLSKTLHALDAAAPASRTRKNQAKRSVHSAQKGYCPYLILGLTANASQDEIFTAYRMKAMAWHPDRHPDHKKKQAKACFMLIKDAYERLKTPERRAAYEQSKRFARKTIRVVNDNTQLGKKAFQALETLFWPFDNSVKKKKNDYLSDIDKIRL
jgi:DnaJ-class molecular chaperone